MTHEEMQKKPQHRCRERPRQALLPTTRTFLMEWEWGYHMENGRETVVERRYALTILSDRLEHTLQYVIIDNDVEQTNAVEIPIKDEGEN